LSPVQRRALPLAAGLSHRAMSTKLDRSMRSTADRSHQALLWLCP